MTESRMSDIEFRTYRPGDEARILETFNLTFREACGPDFVDRTLARWHWEFVENPAGYRIMLALAADGRVAAQYAAVPLRVWAAIDGGRELGFFHAVDSMVHPDFRQGLRKRPLFLEVAERFFAEYGGTVDHLGFGYPVRPAWRIGERYLGYRLVRNLEFLRRSCGGPVDESHVAVERITRFPAEADGLFEGLRGHSPCITIKNAAWLNWRYADCPDVRYRMLWAHRAGRPAGFAVVRVEGGLVPKTATIGDLLLDPADRECLHALVARADDLAAEAGCTHLMTVHNPTLPLAAAFADIGFVTEPSGQWLERKLGSRDWTSGLTPEWLAEHWAYSLGDSDLF